MTGVVLERFPVPSEYLVIIKHQFFICYAFCEPVSFIRTIGNAPCLTAFANFPRLSKLRRILAFISSAFLVVCQLLWSGVT